MKFMWGQKDGGPESEVTCYGFEWKRGFSVLLLRFTPRTREEFHSHAFNCINRVLAGELHEEFWCADIAGDIHYPCTGWFPIYRDTYHRTRAGKRPDARCWVLSLRGPWADTWKDGDKMLTHGRKEVK